MMVRNSDGIERTPVKMDEVEGTYIQWLVSKFDGAPNFAMRRFTMEPGGRIGLHKHPWEHEIYILKGSGSVYNDKKTVPITAGDVIYIPGDELHGYDNTGEGELMFICMVPNEADQRSAS
ncbi:MAG: cupin domain-containing protein [Candidatus Thermoplasmatota archaeon]|nr:cupin domain-containing protein [Candidatus Thermoplasmatota archaeon]